MEFKSPTNHGSPITLRLLVQIGDIIVFRHRGDVQIGMLQGVSGKKNKVATGSNRILEIPSDRVIQETGIRAVDLPALMDVRQRIEELADSLDLKEVWEVLKDEPVEYSVQDIAEFYWGDDIGSERHAAMLLHLSRPRLYFDKNDTAFMPRSSEQIQEVLQRQARQQAVQAEEADFIRWILDESEHDYGFFTTRQKHWLQRIQQYAISGDEYEQSNQARALLKEIKGEGSGDLQRFAFNLMVRKKIWDEDEHLDLILFDIPIDFPPEILDEAVQMLPVETDREDLTGLLIFSIDDASTRDIDDALSAERTEDGYRIGVHIADVSSIIPKGSPLDLEARQRTTSLYFPERNIPMLPPSLSQDQCSLLQDERRVAMSFFFHVAPDFELLDSRIVPSVIINHAKLSYDEADQILGETDHPYTEALHILNEAVDTFYQQRIDQGAIELERNELSIKVDETNKIEVSIRDSATRSEHIVSELMILTNMVAAKYFAERQIPAVYRTQREPDISNLDEVGHEVVHRFMTLRRLKPLELSLEPKPHATLGADMYCQITSPIRRYNDLILQRQLSASLQNQPFAYDSEVMMDELSLLERSKVRNKIWAGREWYWLLKYVNDQKNMTMKAVVLESRPRDVLVELLDFGSRLTLKPEGQLAVGDEIIVQPIHVDARAGRLKVGQVKK